MIERYSEVYDQNKKFFWNIYSQYGLGIVKNAVERELEDYEFHRDSVAELFTQYYEAPKRLGSIDEESLSNVALQAISYAGYVRTPKELKAELFGLGASAAWEAAFVATRISHNSINTVDERLEMISVYEKMNTAAICAYGDNTAEHHRVSLRLKFSQVLKDIVCGDISADTVEETRELLATALGNVGSISDRNEAQGVVGEIKVLQHYWNSYHKDRDMVALPSTVRGGSGHSRPEETHDIDVIRQRKDKSWVTLSPVEVKKSKLRDEEFKRYVHSLLAYVAPDGTVSFTSQHRVRPEPGQEVAS